MLSSAAHTNLNRDGRMKKDTGKKLILFAFSVIVYSILSFIINNTLLCNQQINTVACFSDMVPWYSVKTLGLLCK